MDKKSGKFMERTATLIVDKKNIIIFFFLAAAVFCAFSRSWVEVNDDITYYLPADTETRRGLDLMNREFSTFASAQVMVENVIPDTAVDIKDRIAAIDGVKSVAYDDGPEHYASTSALFTVTFNGGNDDEVSEKALEEVKGMLDGYDLYISSEVGNPLEKIINSEMLIVDAIAVVIIISVLLLTSKTYGEIPVLLITFGAAALLNMGTNFLMGTISFVTNSVAIVLQLALAIDYAIILCHRFTEEREGSEAREAAIKALSKAIPEVSASSLTTISGLMALCLMKFRLGYDMGAVLIKAILCSMLSVFLLMPGLLVLFSGIIDRTHHRNFVPKINFLGRAVYATRYVMPVVFVAVAVLSCVFSGRVNYAFSQSSISTFRRNEAQIAAETIESVFGKKNQLALLIPAGDYESETKIIEQVEELKGVSSVTGLANIEVMEGRTLTEALTPREFSELSELDVEAAELLYTGYAMNRSDYGQIITNLDNYRVPLIDMFTYLCDRRSEFALELDEDTESTLGDLEKQLDDARLQLMSDEWSRIVIMLDLPPEGEQSFDYLNILHGIAARYYDEYYLVGDTTSCFDLKASFEKDNLMISILSIVFVVAVLIFSFKSVGLPVLLIMIIQGSIWINFAVPYLQDENLFFLTYLIISSIQMGANIDYAIVISGRYMEFKEKMPLKEAMMETLNHAFPTIITSGMMLASAGFIIALITSNETISSIGVYLGTGTAISIFLVMCVLPQILLLGDIIIRKTSFTINPAIAPVKKTGLIRVDGRVRGSINGLIDAEIHGLIRGELNALVDIGNITEQQEELLKSMDDTEDDEA